VDVSLEPIIGKEDAWSRNDIHVRIKEMMESSGLVSIRDGQEDFLRGDEKWEENIESVIEVPWVPDDVDIDSASDDGGGMMKSRGAGPDESRSPSSSRWRPSPTGQQEQPSRQTLPKLHGIKPQMTFKRPKSIRVMEVDADGLVSNELWTRLVGESLRLVSMPMFNRTSSSFSGHGSTSGVHTGVNAGSRSRATSIGLIRSRPSEQSNPSKFDEKDAVDESGSDLGKSERAIDRDGAHEQSPNSEARPMAQQVTNEESFTMKSVELETNLDERLTDKEGQAGSGEEGACGLIGC
jgi:hypothetical protein